jgi:hypothetical protein
MLINFRIAPAVADALVPSFFRPKLVNGWAMGGICLIRLKEIRPRCFPASFGLASENAAHRIAIEWEEKGLTHEGVFIPRRDTSSRLQALAGGKLFPGSQSLADFQVNERDETFELKMRSRDGTASIEIAARCATQFPATSIFGSLTEASDFFARGSAGYSATKNPECCDGMELHTASWEVEPLEVSVVRSSFFADTRRFPQGTIHFDCGLLMRNIAHEWRVLPRRESH